MLLARFILTIVAFAGLASALFAGTFTFTTLSDPSATGGTSASGINDEGQIVGTFIGPNVCAPYGLVCTNNGFLYDGGTFTNRALGSDFTGINNLGQIVGYSLYLGSSFNYVPSAFLYSGGVSTAIPTPSYISTASGINDAGQIVGSYLALYSYAAFLNQGTTTITIFDPLGNETNANGINDNGQIVGCYGGEDGLSHLFIDTGGVFTTIAAPNSYRDICASGINDSGEIVGSYFDGTLEHGFLYGNGIFTTIDDPLASAGSYPSQSDGTMVNGINSEGQIVGSYTVATGQEYGFVATPGALPEPSTLSLAFAASLFLLGCGARKLLRD